MPKSRSGQRPKKRKPPMNRFVASKKEASTPHGSSEKGEQSTSRRKIGSRRISVDKERAGWNGFRLIDINKVFGEICSALVCRECHGDVLINETKTVGMSSVFVIQCSKCTVQKDFRNSEAVTNEPRISETNRRLVYAARMLGIGHAGLTKLCGIMDLPPPVTHSAYTRAMERYNGIIKEVAKKSMETAVSEEVRLSGSCDITVSGDGSWQKRGFTSKNGLVTLIGVKTGKCVDLEVLSTICKACEIAKHSKTNGEFLEWHQSHLPVCTINHTGSPGMMEVTGMQQLFRRSIEMYGVRYHKYIGDGDSKVFKNISEDKPYGEDFVIEKHECIAHVQKRMGTRLRNLKKDPKHKKLSDGKPIGGRNRLTDKKIDMLASFYGNAIRGSKDVATMKNNIMATFYHYSSTDEHPQHHLCPTGLESWCKYNVAVAQNEVETFEHKTVLPPAVMEVLKPVYLSLSDESLLRKCAGGYTQNPNESLNGLVWKVAPKTIYCGKKVVEVGAYSAALVFNDGQRSILKVLSAMGTIPGKFCVQWVQQDDEKRKKRSDRQAEGATKEARKARRRASKERQEILQLEEGPSYVPGGF